MYTNQDCMRDSDMWWLSRLNWQCIKRISEVWHLGFELENGQESKNGSGTANATSGLFFGHYFGKIWDADFVSLFLEFWVYSWVFWRKLLEFWLLVSIFWMQFCFFVGLLRFSTLYSSKNTIDESIQTKNHFKNAEKLSYFLESYVISLSFFLDGTKTSLLTSHTRLK